MMSDTGQVIVTTEDYLLHSVHALCVHHRDFPEVRSPGAGSPWGLPPTAPTDPDVHINASGSSRCGISLSLTRLGRLAVTRR